MRYGILGDIHSNLSALETVLAHIRREGVDHIVSVGDVVGYGAAPHECIQLLRECGATVVKGNHDAACVGEVDERLFNPYARTAIEWTRTQLGPDDLHWLQALPLVAQHGPLTVVHATLAHADRYDYVQAIEDADPSLDEMQTQVCVAGHTHVPVSILRLCDDPRTAYTVDSTIRLEEVRHAFVNVGAVGQPRDEDCRAAYAVYDTEAGCISILRVEYDIAREAARIRAAGLPGVLADRLFLGV